MQLEPIHQRIYLLFSVLIVSWNLALGQSDKLQRAEQYITKAESYYAAAQYEASIREYQFAARIYRELNKVDYYAVCYNGVGKNYIELSRYNEAREEFARVLALYADAEKNQARSQVDSSLIADALEGLGRFRMQVNVSYDSALLYHEEALRLRRKAYGDKHEKIALSYTHIAACYRALARDSSQQSRGIKPSDERDLLERALNIQLQSLGDSSYQVANTYEAIGEYYYDVKKDYQQGFEFHKKALDIRLAVFGVEHPKITGSYINLAKYYRAINRFEEELSYLEQALELQKNSIGEIHALVAQSYILLGNRYRFLGDYERALQDYQKALFIHEELGSGRSAEVAEALHDKALCYRGLQKHREEYDALLKALDMRRSIYGNEHYLMADSYTELGRYYGQRGRNDSLLFYYQQALSVLEKQLEPEHILISQSYDKLAQAYHSLEQEEEEFRYLQKAIESKTRAMYGKKTQASTYEQQMLQEEGLNEQTNAQIIRYSLYESYLNLGEYHYNRRSLQSALEAAHKALVCIAPSLEGLENKLERNPSIRELSYNIDWMQALKLKGASYLRLYEEAGKSKEQLDGALQCFGLAMNLIDTLRISFSGEGSKQQLTAQSMPVYEGMIRSLYLLHEQDKSEETLYKIYEIIERSRAFLLLQALQNIEAKNLSAVPSELLFKEDLLRRQMAYYANYKNRTAENQADFDREYLKIKAEYEQLLKYLEAEYPQYFDNKHQNKILGVKQVRALLARHTDVLIQYFVGESHIYAYILSEKTAHCLQLELPKDMLQIVSELRLQLSDYQAIIANPKQAYTGFVRASRRAYRAFFEPVQALLPAGSKRLSIVPDASLHYIPFEVLLQEDPDANAKAQSDYKTLSYLIRDYELNYAYSATLLFRRLGQSLPSNNMRIAAFAPSYENLNESLDALPGAERELQVIEKILKGQFFYGEKASKDVFLREAKSAGIIHLATHGLADLRRPLHSNLAFARGLSKEAEASALYAYEIHHLGIEANLVVLSACETGFGQLIKGEGVQSLARAFLYAGASGVVTTLWKVNDAVSASLMGLFYQNLARGMSKPEAMRQAKLEYLARADQLALHPAFWSSFITVGDPRPVRISWPWWYYALSFVFLSLAAAAFWQLYGRKRFGRKLLAAYARLRRSWRKRRKT